MKSTTKSPFFSIRILSAVAVFAGLAFLVGCESTGTGGSVGSADNVFNSLRTSGEMGREEGEKIAIKKGMSKAEIVALLGEPTEVQDVSEGDTVAEIWVYSRSRVVGSTIEYNGEQERVQVDITTGAMETVREPIYRNEEVLEQTRTQLLFNGDELIAFKEEVIDGILKVGDN